MSQSVYLLPMTAQMYHAYYREYQNDPDLYMDKKKYRAYVYDSGNVNRYIQRQIDLKRICFAIMHGSDMAGELIIKNIEAHKCATLGISMKNAKYKDRGFGTQAERLAIEYVFNELDIPVLYADSILTNERSQHVLEKVGFTRTCEDETFVYYRLCRENWKLEE